MSFVFVCMLLLIEYYIKLKWVDKYIVLVVITCLVFRCLLLVVMYVMLSC